MYIHVHAWGTSIAAACIYMYIGYRVTIPTHVQRQLNLMADTSMNSQDSSCINTTQCTVDVSTVWLHSRSHTKTRKTERLTGYSMEGMVMDFAPLLLLPR